MEITRGRMKRSSTSSNAPRGRGQRQFQPPNPLNRRPYGSNQRPNPNLPPSLAASATKARVTTVDYTLDRGALKRFLMNYSVQFERSSTSPFMDDAPLSRDFIYLSQLEEILERDRKMLIIELDDLSNFDDPEFPDLPTGKQLTEKIENNTLRYLSLAYQAVDDALTEMQPLRQPSLNSQRRDVLDVLIQQRWNLSLGSLRSCIKVF